LIVAAIVVLIGGFVLLLATGDPSFESSSPAGESGEPSGDVVVADGPEPPAETELADIVDATVVVHDSSVVFRARMARSIPQRVKGGTMSWRWDIYDNGAATWILSADLNVGPTASLHSTQTNYGSSTFDDTLPGKMVIEGDRLVITLHPADLEGWPDAFEWTLGTSLDGAQGNPRSALATDVSPDEGRIAVGS
jgi:hypothetical protein